MGATCMSRNGAEPAQSMRSFSGRGGLLAIPTGVAPNRSVLCQESVRSPLARRALLDYRGSTMVQKRAGKTVKVSVSLDKDDLAALKKRARESHRGNLSAAFAEAAR